MQALAVGNPIAGTCHSGYTFAANGCTGGHYIYTLTIESSSVTFGSVLFEVRTSTGAAYELNATTGFSVMTIGDNVAAQTPFTFGEPMAMDTTFSTYGSGVSGSTDLTSVYTILIDVGTTNPAGMGLSFVASGTGDYTGSSSPVSLP